MVGETARRGAHRPQTSANSGRGNGAVPGAVGGARVLAPVHATLVAPPMLIEVTAAGTTGGSGSAAGRGTGSAAGMDIRTAAGVSMSSAAGARTGVGLAGSATLAPGPALLAVAHEMCSKIALLRPRSWTKSGMPTAE